MIKTAINPWQWQFERNYAQAIEVKNAQSTLYCSGQVAIDQNGISSNADMKNYGVLLDGGTLIFSGNSTIYEDVKGAETHQTARIIVFDPDGKAEANPNLNIYHNDVIAASHAATVGKVNDEHLYYLGSRGLDEFDAKKLITKGYLQPIIELIDDDTLKDKLLHDLEGIL